MPLVELTVNFQLSHEQVELAHAETVRILGRVFGKAQLSCQSLVVCNASLSHDGDARTPCANWRVSCIGLEREDDLVTLCGPPSVSNPPVPSLR